MGIDMLVYCLFEGSVTHSSAIRRGFDFVSQRSPVSKSTQDRILVLHEHSVVNSLDIHG